MHHANVEHAAHTCHMLFFKVVTVELQGQCHAVHATTGCRQQPQSWQMI
jgi:hypothetical protein